MENKIKTIKISEVYSPIVKGRYHPQDGEFTGERFRNEFLEPIFNDFDIIKIDLDDSYGYPSSFREEAFGGLARNFPISDVLNKLEFICTDEPPLIKLINNDIKNARKKS